MINKKFDQWSFINRVGQERSLKKIRQLDYSNKITRLSSKSSWYKKNKITNSDWNLRRWVKGLFLMERFWNSQRLWSSYDLAIWLRRTVKSVVEKILINCASVHSSARVKKILQGQIIVEHFEVVVSLTKRTI